MTANQLMLRQGVASTTYEEIKVASGVSKSQLYFHFPDKDLLVEAVVRARAALVIAREERQLGRLNSIRGLERWRDALVQTNAADNSTFGCGIGALASELADRDDEAREVLQETFVRWQGLIETGLERMREAGRLRKEADPRKLSVGLLAALQGGYLLAQAARDSEPMKVALDMAIDHVRGFATERPAPAKKRTKSG
ncbi:MAG TPA: TetR family transcriptional regulator C-terminal domain-containing protein [Solirubrobacteraceae bacterium]|jgi:AcrR family transcriptional regulator|nr:TetR family transcriptional regulator C-terminal domain-containing protein [Solirubrobacteraceae bacterium]